MIHVIVDVVVDEVGNGLGWLRFVSFFVFVLLSFFFVNFFFFLNTKLKKEILFWQNQWKKITENEFVIGITVDINYL